MTTELEKQFFDTFGIEQIEYTQCTTIGCKHIYGDCNNCQFRNVYKIDYPQITDRHYLELICVLNKNTSIMDRLYKNEMHIECLKNTVLNDLIRVSKLYDIKHQVQAIFRGEG